MDVDVQDTTLVIEDDRDEEAKTLKDEEELEDVLDPLTERTRHETLWFKDGTVVLATSDTLFRIFGGLLSLHSKVFRDKLALSASKAQSDQMCVDGVAVVELEDNSWELGQFLSALHDRSFYRHTEPTKFNVVLAIFQLSTKYRVHVLRQQTLSHLSTLYPDTLQGYATRRGRQHQLIEEEDDVDMINIGRETHTVQLLPIAFYTLTINWLRSYGGEANMTAEKVLQYYQSLSMEDLARVLAGREALSRALRNVIGKFLYVRSPTECTGKSCIRVKALCLTKKVWTGLNDVPDILDRELIGKVESCTTSLCEVCQAALTKSLEGGQRKVWEELPGYFCLDDWKTLREDTANFLGSDSESNEEMEG